MSLRPTFVSGAVGASLSRALDSAGATIDCVRSGWRAAAAAHRLVRQALPDPAHPRPRVINTDRARRYGSAIARMQQEGIRQRHQLLLPRPYLVLTKPLRLDIQCQRAASVKIGWKYLDD